MEKETSYYHDLIAKYFAGELTGEGLSVLSAWLKSGIDNREAFNNYKQIWEIVEKSKIEALDTNAEWAKLKNKITTDQKSETKVIHLETGNTKNKSFFRQTMRIAAVILALLGLTFIILTFTKHPPVQKQLMALNEKVEGKLPDGTNVTLNAGSTLNYPEKFKGKERAVKLTGEAFFEVTPNKSKPFKIAANEIMAMICTLSGLIKTGMWK